MDGKIGWEGDGGAGGGEGRGGTVMDLLANYYEYITLCVCV